MLRGRASGQGRELPSTGRGDFARSVAGIRATCLVLLVAIGLGWTGRPAHAESKHALTDSSQEISARNPTGRVLHMPLPLLIDDDRKLAELMARIDVDGRIWVRRDALVAALERAVKPEVSAKAAAIADTGGQIEIAAVSASGIELLYEPGNVALRVVPKADLRTPQTISLAGGHGRLASAAVSKPSLLAGYLNMIAGIDQHWGRAGHSSRTGLNLELQSAMRWGAFVVENEAVIDSLVDPETCPRGAYCAYVHESGFKRRLTRLVYDRPEDSVRLQAGDVSVDAAGMQRITETLGVAIAKAPRILQPDGIGRATTSQSFIIERPSDVEIVVNGVSTRKLRLRPGAYDLRDLALVAGNNQLEVVITDDTGAQRKLKFSTFFDGKLLTQGASEWSLSAGVPSYYRDGLRAYAQEAYAGSGFFRYGLSDYLTAEVSGQADEHVALGGVGILAATAWGFLGTQVALSHGESVAGYAVAFNWDLVNFDSVLSFAGPASARFSAEYRSPSFRQPGEFLTTATGLIYPQFNYWLSLSAAYSMPVGWGYTATLAGRYQFANDAVVDAIPFGATRGDRYGGDLSIGGPITEYVNGSLTVGYSNETLLRFATAHPVSDDAEFRIMARMFVRLDNRMHVSGSVDTLNRQTMVSGLYSHGSGINRWETSVDAYRSGLTKDSTISGAAAFYGNRAETRVSVTGALDDQDLWGGASGSSGHVRSSARVGTSVAFADGRVAVGAPIRGNAFAIVYPHESLAGKTIKVGSSDDARAIVDGWGATVVTDLPAYTSTSLPVDVADLPVGYSLGAGAFDVLPPYRAGYALEVGSDNSVSVFGTLLDNDHAPVALLAGVAYPNNDTKRQVSVLTNAVGRFSAEGLSPGAWTIEMPAGNGVAHYALDVPKGTEGLLRAGVLQPVGGRSPEPQWSTSSAPSTARTDHDPTRDVHAWQTESVGGRR